MILFFYYYNIYFKNKEYICHISLKNDSLYFKYKLIETVFSQKIYYIYFV